jgi:hypothetical protein
MRVDDTRDAVGSESGVHLDERPDAPPAGWKIPFFFTKILHFVQNFCEKENKEYHAAAGDSAVHRVKRPV